MKEKKTSVTLCNAHLRREGHTPRGQKIAESFFHRHHVTPPILGGERDLKGGHTCEHAARRRQRGREFAAKLREFNVTTRVRPEVAGFQGRTL